MKNSKDLLNEGSVECDTQEEALQNIKDIHPKDEEFVFNNPEGWEELDLSLAKVIEVSEGEEISEAQNILDGKVSTSWKTNNYHKKPEVIIDLREIENISTIVVFNRYSSARGTGGGNNAVKTLELGFSVENSSDFKSLGIFELNGPIPFCAKIKGEGQICTFIDNTSPNIIEIPRTDLRYLKIKLIEAFWAQDIPEDWKDSFSLTKIELYK